MFIYIDKVVAFVVLFGGERYVVDVVLRCVVYQIYVIVSYRFFYFFDMGAQVVNAVVVVDVVIFFYFVVSVKIVFDNKQRFLITFIQFVKCIAQIYWINLLVLVRCFNIRVWYVVFKIRDRIVGVVFGFYCIGYVIVEIKIIVGVFTQYIQIVVFYFDVKFATFLFV